MAGLENLKSQNLEASKLRLLDMKDMIRKIRDKIEQLHQERESSSAQHHKKMKNLNNLEATQSLKLSKLDGEIANAEQVLTERLAEHKSLVRLIETNKQAIRSTAEETETMIADFQEKCREIEESIQKGYLHMQTDADMEVLVEIAQNYFKDGQKLSLLYEMLCAKREDILKRREDINKEFVQIEALQSALARDIKARQENLLKAEELHSDLFSRYANMKRFRKDSLTEAESQGSIADARL